jgi:hypothetical protein
MMIAKKNQVVNIFFLNLNQSLVGSRAKVGLELKEIGEPD